MSDDLLDALAQVESGGRHTDKDGNLITSPAGAIGKYQWIPRIAEQGAGYGVEPFDPTDEAAQREASRQYLLGLQQNNPDWSKEDVLRAYNWGPGNVHRYMSGKRKDIPKEAQEYPSKILRQLSKMRGHETYFNNGGLIGATPPPVLDEEDMLLQELEAEQAGAPPPLEVPDEESGVTFGGVDLTVPEDQPRMNRRQRAQAQRGQGTATAEDVAAAAHDPRAVAQAQRDNVWTEEMVDGEERPWYQSQAGQAEGIVGGRSDAAEERVVDRVINNSAAPAVFDDADVETLPRTAEEQEAGLEEIINDPAENTDGPGNKQQGPQVKNKEVEEIGKQAADEDPGAVSRVAEAFKGAFGELFDDKQLANAAIMYLGSRALGYSHAGSLRWSAKNYLQQQQAAKSSHDKLVRDLVKDQKYSTSSIEAFKKSGNPSDLKANPKSLAGTGEFRTMLDPNGKPRRVQKYKVGEGQHVWQDGQGNQVNTQWRDDTPAYRKGTPEYKARIKKATGDAHTAFEEIYKTEGRERVGDNEWVNHTNITPHQASRDFVAWADRMGLDPDAPETLDIMGNAYRLAIEENKSNKKIKAHKLTPYLESQFIRETTGTPELFMLNREAVDKGEAKPKFVRQDLMSGLHNQVRGLANNRGVKPQDIYQHALKKWSELPEKQREIYNKGGDAGRSGFYDFMVENLTKL